MAPAIITLLTDFGLHDAYVGMLKGVILGLNPAARLVDLSHGVPPQDVLAGAMLLRSAWRYFPAGTIHLAVVDPGVGTRRRALAALAAGHFFVGPDNGLLWPVLAAQSHFQAVSLENSRYFLPEISATFHGRDIFAPVAAHLSLGLPLASLGPPVAAPVPLRLPEPAFQEDLATGEIIALDHFGNLISNIPMARLHAWLAGRSVQVLIQDRLIPSLSQTYGQVPPGALLALEGSHGFLEIACRDGSAARVLGAGVGARVDVKAKP